MLDFSKAAAEFSLWAQCPARWMVLPICSVMREVFRQCSCSKSWDVGKGGHKPSLVEQMRIKAVMKERRTLEMFVFCA